MNFLAHFFNAAALAFPQKKKKRLPVPCYARRQRYLFRMLHITAGKTSGEIQCQVFTMIYLLKRWMLITPVEWGGGFSLWPSAKLHNSERRLNRHKRQPCGIVIGLKPNESNTIHLSCALANCLALPALFKTILFLSIHEIKGIMYQSETSALTAYP